jgi:hypothetical protein
VIVRARSVRLMLRQHRLVVGVRVALVQVVRAVLLLRER